MKISVCMIVKNEDEFIEETLMSLKNKVNEIVVVDTGSVDSTVEIAQKYTDKVFFFKWCDDFSSARNFSISKASNDWILVIDGDEKVIHYNMDQVYGQFDFNKVGRIKRVNVFEDDQGEKRYIERVNRFFNRKYFEYRGIIHEQIHRKDGDKYETVDIDIITDHVGYMNEVIKRTGKLERNIEMLKKEISIRGDDPYIFYQLGKSYYKLKDFSNSKIYFEKSIEQMESITLEYVADLIESYGYSLIKCGDFKDALKLAEFDEIYNNLSGYQFLMGLVFMNNGMFTEAINRFKTCLSLSESGIEGVNSFYANYNMGVIYEVLGDESKASVYYYRSVKYDKSKQRLEIINASFLQNIELYKSKLTDYVNESDFNLAKDFSEILLNITNDPYIKMISGVISSALGYFDEAEAVFSKLLEEKSYQSEDLIYNLAYTFYLQEKYTEALELLIGLKQSTEDDLLIIDIDLLIGEIRKITDML